MLVSVAFDEGEDRRFLISELQADADSIEVLRPGEWSRVYAFRRGREDLVVRFSR